MNHEGNLTRVLLSKQRGEERIKSLGKFPEDNAVQRLYITHTDYAREEMSGSASRGFARSTRGGFGGNEILLYVFLESGSWETFP